MRNGFVLPKLSHASFGGKPLAVDGVKYLGKPDCVRYDPSLTYGKAREKPLPLFVPHFALYDRKCLNFKAFFKQSVTESPLEHYRVRQVNIIYFLEDDTITVIEPEVPVSNYLKFRC